MLGAEIALILFVSLASVIAILLLSYSYYKRGSLKQLRDTES